MNNNYQISIIIPIYNAAPFLPRSIDSVLNQTYKKIELILIDDGSTDNSLSLIKDYQKKNKNIKILSQKNHGAGVARNAGINSATGKYIMFLDADDFLEPECCFLVLHNIKKNNSEFLSFGANFYNKKNKLSSGFEFKNKNLLASDVLSSYLLGGDIKSVVWNKIYSKSFLSKFNIRFNTSRVNEDSFFVMQACVFAKKISFCPGRFYNHTRLNFFSTTNKITPGHYISTLHVLNEEKLLLISHGFFAHFKNSFYIHVINLLTYLIFMGACSQLKFDEFKNCVNIALKSDIWDESKDAKLSHFNILLRLRQILCYFPGALWFFGKLNFK